MTACVDFEIATTAFHHWSEAANENTARADEYLQVMGDLETEILDRLKAHPAREVQHGDKIC